MDRKINKPMPHILRNIALLSATFLVFATLSSYVGSQVTAAGAGLASEKFLSTTVDINQPELVLIPAGSVRTPEPFPLVDDIAGEHIITIAEPFYISKYEVTFDQWDTCVEAGGCSYVPDDKRWGRGNRPVINVSWVDVDQYISWLSNTTGKRYRLPTEFEWEYAARAGSTERFGPPPLFDDPKLAWASSYLRAPVTELQTQPVDTGQANAFGLFGITGNVWEWTNTCFRSSGNTDNESCGIRILRGEHRSYMPNFLREIGTGGCAVKPQPGNFGFRVVSPISKTDRSQA